MSKNVFIPKLNQVQQSEDVEVPEVLKGNDGISSMLQKVAQYAVIALFGLLPIFFTPGLWASLGFDKSLLTIGISSVVVIMVSLLALRRSRSLTVLPISLGLFWAVILVAVVSGMLSGDVQDAIRGSVLETQTAAFLGILALAMTIPLVLQGSKIMSIKALAFFGFSATLLLIYNILRLFLGPKFLALGSFKDVTVSPIGGFNDLALFAGLVIILSLITLVQLPLRTWLQSIVLTLILASLVILSVVNFFNIWIVVGFFSLLIFIYLISKDTLFRSSESNSTFSPSKILLGTTLLVCIISTVFIVAGEYTGGKINKLTNVNYFEVQPTLGATIDIASSVYSENILFGIGPNRFADAWRQYKDPSINETIFWDTDFNSGGGFVPTLFVNLGLLGGVLLVIFHIYFLYLGYKMLLRSRLQDSYWYFFGSASFAAACFVWGMSYVYVPGSAILILGALFTGFTFVAAGALLPSMVRTVPLVVNRQRGFFLMAAIILVVTISVGVLFSVSKQYVAESSFSEAQVSAASVSEFEEVALNSFGLYEDDRFVSARAQIQLANLSSLLGIQTPTKEEQQRFLTSAEKGITFADRALKEDPTNPDNHAILAGVYSNLAVAGVDGAQERAEAALAEAQRLDSLNPGYRLISAQLAARLGDLPKAREEIAAALKLKQNFTQALYLSAQLDINEGKTESAIATTRSIVTLEPNNPTRYFQLGVLLSANNNHLEAIEAFKAAVILNPVYANARYLLALAYMKVDQPESALEQLRIVQQTNKENTDLNKLIAQIESGEYVAPADTSLDVPVSEVTPVEGFEDTVTTSSDVDTDLVAPVNTISDTESDEETPVSAPEEVVSEVEPVTDTEVIE